MSELNKEELLGMENIIRKVINCDQFTNSIDNPTEKREKNIKWAVEQIVALIKQSGQVNVLITPSNALSVCCKAKIKMNPIEWESPHRIKSWEFWCLKCRKKCEGELKKKKIKSGK